MCFLCELTVVVDGFVWVDAAAGGGGVVVVGVVRFVERGSVDLSSSRSVAPNAVRYSQLDVSTWSGKRCVMCGNASGVQHIIKTPSSLSTDPIA
eukprot:4345458-Amphidinium_carterae.2